MKSQQIGPHTPTGKICISKERRHSAHLDPEICQLVENIVDQLLKEIVYSLSMVMRDIGSFHCPERGVMDTACIPKYHTLSVLLYRYNAFMPVYLHLLIFHDHVYAKVTLLCQDYAMVRRLSLKNFCRNLVKTLSITASKN